MQQRKQSTNEQNYIFADLSGMPGQQTGIYFKNEFLFFTLKDVSLLLTQVVHPCEQ